MVHLSVTKPDLDTTVQVPAIEEIDHVRTISTANKAELLTHIQAEYDCFEALLASLSEEHMTTPGVNGTWSVKIISLISLPARLPDNPTPGSTQWSRATRSYTWP